MEATYICKIPVHLDLRAKRIHVMDHFFCFASMVPVIEMYHGTSTGRRLPKRVHNYRYM